VFTVDSKKAATFMVEYAPHELGSHGHEVLLRVHNNPFEQYRIAVTGALSCVAGCIRVGSLARWRAQTASVPHIPRTQHALLFALATQATARRRNSASLGCLLVASRCQTCTCHRRPPRPAAARGRCPHSQPLPRTLAPHRQQRQDLPRLLPG
jgi:hypothetical protein